MHRARKGTMSETRGVLKWVRPPPELGRAPVGDGEQTRAKPVTARKAFASAAAPPHETDGGLWLEKEGREASCK